MTDVNTPAPPAPSAGGAKEAKAQAKAAKAHAKALRPWYKKKRFLIPLVLVAIMILATVASGGGSDDDQPAPAGETTEQGSSEEQGGTEAGALYPDRPDQQGEDQEAAVGDSVRLSGYTTAVTGATLTREEFTETDLVIIDVRIENRDDSAQAYNTFDFKIQTANGQVLDPSFMADNSIGSGDLVGGGVVEGNVGFEVGPGTYYVIYKPDAFDAARGIWQITVG